MQYLNKVLKWWDETIFPVYLTLIGWEFPTVGVATEKTQVPAFVLTMGTTKIREDQYLRSGPMRQRLSLRVVSSLTASSSGSRFLLPWQPWGGGNMRVTGGSQLLTFIYIFVLNIRINMLNIRPTKLHLISPKQSSQFDCCAFNMFKL